MFQIEFVKGLSHAEDMKKSAGGLQNAVSSPVSSGQSTGGGPRGEGLGSSAYLALTISYFSLKSVISC